MKMAADQNYGDARSIAVGILRRHGLPRCHIGSMDSHGAHYVIGLIYWYRTRNGATKTT